MNALDSNRTHLPRNSAKRFDELLSLPRPSAIFALAGVEQNRRVCMEDRVLTGQSHAVDQTTAQGSATSLPNTDAISVEDLLARILTSLEDDKAEEVVQIDLRGKSTIADYMVIASGRSTRQVAAMSEKLVDRLKQSFRRQCKVEGKDAGDWVLIDAGDVLVHIFRPEVREFYQLEKMWMQPSSTAPQ